MVIWYFEIDVEGFFVIGLVFGIDFFVFGYIVFVVLGIVDVIVYFLWYWLCK